MLSTMRDPLLRKRLLHNASSIASLGYSSPTALNSQKQKSRCQLLEISDILGLKKRQILLSEPTLEGKSTEKTMYNSLM